MSDDFGSLPDPDEFEYNDDEFEKPKRDDPRKRKGRSFDWIEVWIRAVTKPDVGVYREHLADPRMSMTRGLVWMFAASVIGTLLQSLASVFSGGVSDVIDANVSVVSALCCAPFFALIGLIVFVVFNTIQYMFALMIGGKGSFEDQVYSVATYAAPISIILSGASMPPCIGAIAVLAVLLYTFYLHVISMEAVHRFSREKAVIASLWWVLMFCLCLSALIGILIAAGVAAISL